MTRLLRTFSLVVTDRRWAAPLSATALGFGLFIGVAIGPSAAGTLAGTSQIIEIPSSGGSEGEGDGEATGPVTPLAGAGGAGGGGGSLGVLPAPAPLASEPAPEAAEPAPAPKPKAPPSEVPEEDEATELKGVVVHANPAAGSYALAIKGGELVPIHARELPPPGAKLTVAARQLANGTFAEEEKPQRAGKSAKATFTGLITHADPDPTAPAYTVSGRGASLLVHAEPDPAGTAPALPEIGAFVTVTAGLEPADGPPPMVTLVQHEIEVEEGEPSTYLDLAGIVTEVLPETGQLLLSADDSGESEADLTLDLPAEIDANRLKAGDSYLATATLEEDASLTLSGIASDEHTKGADDPALAQGDLKRQGASASSAGACRAAADDLHGSSAWTFAVGNRAVTNGRDANRLPTIGQLVEDSIAPDPQRVQTVQPASQRMSCLRLAPE